ncbi:MAG: [FeFe] hydrogenase H-cluster radical SAM maturase HydE [Eggerthellaceae bacterium]|nr:[FeFe] hydrogenase H-cluster radical SAM maturase HydE [Eggerthellaceae bacterium]
MIYSKFDIVQKLAENRELSDAELQKILETDKIYSELQRCADKLRKEIYGDEVYIRGLIEFSNYCKNNCFYCGIRRSNAKLERYRLTREDILKCCHEGYGLGYRTFVLQSGEDFFYKRADICAIVSNIKTAYPDCAVTLSIGEKTREDYRAFFEAGADRYLLRQETADCEHYAKLHPASMSLETRMRCLYDLKEIGYQVGAGFMVGSPFQSADQIIKDLRFLQRLHPDMIGVGPYLCHKDTPFAEKPIGSLELALRLISVLRLLFPYALIPAVTALDAISPDGRERGLKAGANVVMSNLTPKSVRELYSLYNDKLFTRGESAQCRVQLKQYVQAAGYRIVTNVGNAKRSE